MKRDYDLHMRTKKYKDTYGDLVYWRRNAGKKVQSVWLGPGIVTQIKSDTVRYSDPQEVKILHHDKLRPCISRQLPKWIRDHPAVLRSVCARKFAYQV